MRLIKCCLVLSVLIIASCDNSGSADSDNKKFEAYLKLKRVPLNDEVRYQRMLAEYNQRSALANAVEESGQLDMTMLEVEVEEFRRQLLVNRYFEQYLGDLVTEEGVQNFYRNNIDKYKTKKVHVAHILFRTNPRMQETERQALLTTAHETYSKIMAGGDFAEIAKALSQDKVSGKKGGDLGWINEGAVAKEFSEKAFSMAVGAVSEPFMTTFGFHILKVLESPQEVTKPLEAVKGDIRYQMRYESKQAEKERLLESVGYKSESDS